MPISRSATRVAGTIAGRTGAGGGGSEESLVQYADLTHIGTFVDETGSGLETGGLTFNPANGKLYVVYGYDPASGAAELTIPTLVQSTNFASLNVASVAQSAADVTDNKLRNISSPASTETTDLSGLLVYNDKLIMAGIRFYDASAATVASHFSRSLDLDAGSVTGPVRIQDSGYSSYLSRWQGRQMCHIPSNWQTAMGGPCLASGAGMSIESSGPASLGPNATVFDPDDIGVESPVPGKIVLGYPWNDERDRSLPYLLSGGTKDDRSQNEWWTPTARVGGLCWVEGTRSVLFFGFTGVGPTYYESAELSDPYEYRIWAYDANDLLAVKTGTLDPWEVEPYATWELTFPSMPVDPDVHLDWHISGVAYDATNQRIYVRRVGVYMDGNWRQLIDVLTVE